MRYPVLLLDLFRTVLLFTPQAPTGQVREPHWRSAMEALRGRATALLGGIEFDFFVDALYDVSIAIAKARAPDHFEVPIEERYARALARLGCEGPPATATATRLARLQLDAQAANTDLPSAHATVLRDIARTHRLALVSNFDHSATAHALLAQHDLDRVFSAVVFSIDFGRRKPHPAIFQEALRELDAPPSAALFIGDSLDDDVAGARGAGIDSAWINWAGAPLPTNAVPPTFTLSALTDLPPLLTAPGGR